MEEKETQLKGQATAEEIAKWKEKYGEVYAVSVGDSICYLHKPNRAILSAMGSLGGEPIKSAEFLLSNCWISGDEDIKSDDEKFLGVSQQLGELVKVKVARLEKL